jgi:signal recognition particle subunit SRP19
MGKKNGGVRVKQQGPKGMPSGMPMNPMEDLMSGAGIPADEMIHLPPPQDRSLQIFWPIHETFSMDITTFQVIYPSYLDSNKSIAEGRRVACTAAVPKPTVSDISLALQALQVRHVLQPYKGYSRDLTVQWDNPGRLLVDVKQHTKKELSKEICKLIPSLPERITRVQKEEEEAAAKVKLLQEQQKAIAASSAPKKAAATTGKKKGKYGKKK